MRRQMRRLFVVLPLLAVSFPALAQPAAQPGAQAGSIQVRQVWSRAAPQGRVGVLYLTVTDTGAPDRLVGVETPVADKAELHESVNENGVMTMRPVTALSIVPGNPLTLKPGGYHVMLVGLHQALKEGDSFPVTLRFAGAGAVSVQAQVVKAGASLAQEPAKMDHEHGEMQH